MKYTKLIDKDYVCDSNLFKINEDNMTGDPINKLGKLEYMIEELKSKNIDLSKKMEELRLNGQSKSYQFREYMGMKLTNSRVLAMLEEYQII